MIYQQKWTWWVFLLFGDLGKSCATEWRKLEKVAIFNLALFLNFVDVVLEVLKDIPAWPGRHLLEGGENLRYFALKTVLRGVVEFECRSQREYDMWTQGVSRLLAIAAEKNNRNHLL